MISVNQNRQFYVVKSLGSTFSNPPVPGDAVIVDKKNYFYILQVNASKEPVRSDLIYKRNIIAVKESFPATDLNKLKVVAVTLNDSPVVGEDYILTINIRNFAGAGTDTTYVKTIPLHVTSDISSKVDFYTALKTAAEKSFSREATIPFTFEVVTYSGDEALLIKENPSEWSLGVEHEIPVVFDVFCDEVNGEPWGDTEVSYGDNPTLNSKKVADLEWFCMGERGDQYRNIGWPDVIPTKYMVNSESEEGYVLFDIHYAYIGDGMENQASEKTLTIAIENSDSESATIAAMENFLENGLGASIPDVGADTTVGDEGYYYDTDPATVTPGTGE